MKNIRLLQDKNVYGARVEAGTVLEVSKDIPPWQAQAFMDAGVAEFVEAPKVKKKGSKK